MKIDWQAEAPAPQDTQGLAQQGGTDAFVCQPQVTAIFSQPAEVPYFAGSPIACPFRFTSSIRSPSTCSITFSSAQLSKLQCASRIPVIGALSYPRKFTARLLFCDVMCSSVTLRTTGLKGPPRPSRSSPSA